MCKRCVNVISVSWSSDHFGAEFGLLKYLHAVIGCNNSGLVDQIQ